MKKQLLRDLETFKYEKTEQGLYFPRVKGFVRGEYTHNVNGMDERVDQNNITDEGLIHMLGVTLYSTTRVTAWYLALYAANYTPVAGLTAASFPATASEITSGSEGYTQSTRQAFTPSAPSADIIDNIASKAAFTIATASSLNVNGAALLSDSAKGSTSGTCMSAAKFAATRVLYAADVFNLGYRVQLVSS